MLDYNFIKDKAKRERIDEVTVEREYYQLLFLQRLYLYKGSENFHFKGGTAIRFLLHSFRFSEDLDFTFKGKSQEAEAILNKTFDFFIKNSPQKVEVKKTRVPEKFKDFSLGYRFLFLPTGKSQKVSIRIEVSLREQPLTSKSTLLTPFDYPISPYPLVVHLSFGEIFAEKIRALIVRKKPRDLFDFWFLCTKKVELRKDFVQEKMKLYPKLKFSKEILKQTITSIPEKEMRQDLNQFLPFTHRKITKLLKEESLKFAEGLLL